jgi:hypothetical protein
MKNSNDTIANRTRDLPACSAVPHPTAPPRVFIIAIGVLQTVLIRLKCIKHKLRKWRRLKDNMTPCWLVNFSGVSDVFVISIFRTKKEKKIGLFRESLLFPPINCKQPRRVEWQDRKSRSSETSVCVYQSSRRYILEDLIVNDANKRSETDDWNTVSGFLHSWPRSCFWYLLVSYGYLSFVLCVSLSSFIGRLAVDYFHRQDVLKLSNRYIKLQFFFPMAQQPQWAKASS